MTLPPLDQREKIGFELREIGEVPPGITDAARGIETLKLIVAVYDLIAVGKHPLGEGNFFGRKALKFILLESFVASADFFGYGKTLRSVRARRKIGHFAKVTAKKRRHMEIGINQNLPLSAKFLSPEAAQGQPHHQIGLFAKTQTPQKRKSIPCINGDIRRNNFARTQQNLQGSCHFVHPRRCESVYEEDFHRKAKIQNKTVPDITSGTACNSNLKLNL